MGWTGEDLTGLYSTFPDKRKGSSYDIKAGTDKGPRLLEIKVAESFDESHGWFEDRAPLHYEFQGMDQIHCMLKDDPTFIGFTLGTLGRRQKTRLYHRVYDPKVGALIDEEVASFWKSIDLDQEPKPDYSVDSEILETLRKPLRTGDVINLSLNNRAVDLIETYAARKEARDVLREQIKPIDKEMKAIEAEIHHLMGRNERAIIGDHQVGAKVQTNEERIQYETSFRRFDHSKRRK